MTPLSDTAKCVEHYRRAAAGWTVEVLAYPLRRLDLDAIGFALDLDTVYFDVPVLRPVMPAEDFGDEPPTPLP